MPISKLMYMANSKGLLVLCYIYCFGWGFIRIVFYLIVVFLCVVAKVIKHTDNLGRPQKKGNFHVHGY